MDPFEEFEMKPLTEGLGFHNKQNSLRESVKKAKLYDQQRASQLPQRPPEELLDSTHAKGKQETSIDDIMAALDGLNKNIEQKTAVPKAANANMNKNSDVQLSTTLPRVGENKRLAVSTEVDIPRDFPVIPHNEPMPDFLEDSASSQARKKPTEAEGTRRSAADSPLRHLKPVPVSIASALLDALVVLSFSLIFLVSVLLITEADLFVVIGAAQYDVMVQISLAVIYLAVMQIYVVVARSLFAKTLGEWTFDLQMGDNAQIKSGVYPMLILWRSLVILMTGFLMLPLFSFIVRKDLASYLSGLQLYRKV